MTITMISVTQATQFGNADLSPFPLPATPSSRGKDTLLSSIRLVSVADFTGRNFQDGHLVRFALSSPDAPYQHANNDTA